MKGSKGASSRESCCSKYSATITAGLPTSVAHYNEIHLICDQFCNEGMCHDMIVSRRIIFFSTVK